MASMTRITTQCPACARFIIVDEDKGEVNPTDCKCGVLISVVREDSEDALVKSLAESWGADAETIKRKPHTHPSQASEGAEIDFGDDLKIIAFRFRRFWVVFQDL